VAEPHEDNKTAYSNLSLCYFKLKKYQSCIDACNSALELDPKYPKVLYRKTLAYELLGETLGIYRSAKAYCDLCKDQKDGEWDKMRKMADDAEIAIAHVHPENVKEKFKFLIVSPQADKDSKT
jgi:tetratricopeptide (TPR) repeat protein